MMAEDLKRALREVRDELLLNPVSPRVDAPADINLRYCRYVAETVAERVGDEYELELVEDGGRGFLHTWIRCDGRYYDAECIDGVLDYRELPFFERHPEAVVHIEPETTDPAAVRNRGKEPLYPAMFTSETSAGVRSLASTEYTRYAIGGVLVGLFLFAIGVGGTWAIHEQFLRQLAWLSPLFYDLEIVGELIALVSPVIFFFLRPAHRASPQD